MGLWNKTRVTVGNFISGARAATGGTWHSLSGAYGAAIKTMSGVKLTEKAAMSLSVYYACIRNIAEDVGKLPLITYERNGRGKDRALNHANFGALHDAPNPLMTSATFRETLTSWALGWGNGYAEISRNPRGLPQLYPIHPSRVKPHITKDNTIVYQVKNAPGADDSYIPQSNMLHIHGLGMQGVTGYSVLQFASESVGLGLAAQSFGASFFGNGANGGSVLEVDGELGDKGFERLRKSWAETYEGVKNSNKPIILENGMKFTPLSIPPNEAQFLETREFNVEDVCRWFRMPIHKVQHHKRAQGWSTLDASNTDYVTDTLMPWLVRWEQEIKRKLFVADPQFFAEHMLNALLRGDMKTRAQFYRIQLMNGALSPNDIRAAENMNPVDGGDVYMVPANLMSLPLTTEGTI